MTFPKRLLSMVAGLTVLSSVASGYYHFVYFAGRSGSFNPINLQFDLSKLTNNTVYYFISDQGPNVFVPGDSFPAVISELQLAAKAWNSFPQASVLNLEYGGLSNSATQQSAPGIDVVFDDNNIAPGILAQTKVSTYADVSFIANNPTSFLPILRSRIQFRKDLTVTVPQQASYYDSSFTIMVHEFGHAIGLQHTLTSAAMSTYITRSTTKAMPIAADDIAGVALMYPAAGYLSTTGSIQGQVTLNGSGVNLASVVAISPVTGVAISKSDESRWPLQNRRDSAGTSGKLLSGVRASSAASGKMGRPVLMRSYCRRIQPNWHSRPKPVSSLSFFQAPGIGPRPIRTAG